MKPRQPSETALRIAGNRVAAARDPVFRRFLPDPDEPFSRWFIEAHSPRARRQLWAWSWGPTRRLLSRLTDVAMPGGMLYMLLRKRYVEDAARAALAAGAEQVVIFGGGFDPLALRLARDFPAVRIFETDHPDTQSVKRAALERHGALPDTVTLIPVDYARETAADCLRATPGFRPGARGFFLAEGLMMYLERDAIVELFRTVRENGAAGSTFLFTMVDAHVLADADSAASRSARIAERMGEPFRTAIRREDLPVLAANNGFRLTELADRETLRERYQRPLGLDLPLIDGELIVTAVRE